jgi:uncharacterized protein involved in response to NO
LLGVSVLIIGEQFNIPSFISLGKVLFYKSGALCLILGIGSRLIPALLGWGELPQIQAIQKKSLKTNYIQEVPPLLKILFIMLFCSFFSEVFFMQQLGILIQTVVVFIISIKIWKIYKKPKSKTFQAWGLIVSAWCLNLGLLASLLCPNQSIHTMHLFYIGGFGLMTFMIATRVLLAHGGHNVQMGEKSPWIIVIIFLIFMTALTRVSIGFLPSTYQTHVMYAAWLWIISVVIWGIRFLRLVF